MTKNVVQNRYFLKEKRLRSPPWQGHPEQPHGAALRRRRAALLPLRREPLGWRADLLLPDQGTADLKGLTNTLVQIAHNGDPNVDFQQPVDKMRLGATFSLNWAPVYGKINLFGQTVVNFDLYGSVGLGMLANGSTTRSTATPTRLPGRARGPGPQGAGAGQPGHRHRLLHHADGGAQARRAQLPLRRRGPAAQPGRAHRRQPSVQQLHRDGWGLHVLPKMQPRINTF
ncbi:MAG: hypothetical protein H6739_16225 [Alphaproteobacteria bacterium]|nr:hypothetical protein [Alphaproteobacteria bacterium]